MSEVVVRSETDGYPYRIAQGNRLLRFWREQGIDVRDDDFEAGRRPRVSIDPILDQQGKIVPQSEDFAQKFDARSSV